ncbi:glutaconate CoA-transferase subunit A [Fontimonas thermophila]|uniref:Glutaconate CoA-transferase subunit A n=1 Tax=Fontimonas thermophila TaxID=1076937 RepID=A0A1I2JW42_9GAMM|nr:CoA-transferase [Fontimonas thermophila]SFF57257.1 glutaconate CoA-transferase subunit A [Fontimonas thermophila]
MSFDKRMTASEVVATLRDGMTLGIGGWGPRRKPMAIVREILRSDLRDLTVVAYGGPDVGLLCAAGKVRKLIYAFVSLDFIPLEPFFRKARESGAVEAIELDEGLLHWGLRAAAMRLPFLPTRVGLATDQIGKAYPGLRTVTSPYEDGEVLLAMPALKLDVALLHVHCADAIGNVRVYAPDPFFDELFARAAERCYVSCEQLVERIAGDEIDARFHLVERNRITGVVHAPGGAHPTSNVDVRSAGCGYGWDGAHLARYCTLAEADDGFAQYARTFLHGDEAAYQAAVGGLDAIRALPRQVF